MINNNKLHCNAPMYLQLREIIRTKIEEGEFLPGQAIPSENTFAMQYNLNRMTVRSAISALINEGILISVHGKGVYAIGNKIEENIQTEGGFTESTVAKDRNWGNKIFLNAYRSAGEKYASIFKIDKEDNIYYIRNIFYLNDEPYSIEDAYIPFWVIPNFEKIDLSVFRIEEVYAFNNINIIKEDQELTITIPNLMDARRLKLEANIAVLATSFTKYDENNKVVLYKKSYTRADKCSFKVFYHRK